MKRADPLGQDDVLLGKLLSRWARAFRWAKLTSAGRRVRFTIDHLTPITEGGTNEPENLALAQKPKTRKVDTIWS
ncbi:MAG TPA: HNH endonuclease [Pyrinomonadaceae bacterium]|nr:HNH endonuclease [Pyrinomonadaceae bacterium]